MAPIESKNLAGLGRSSDGLPRVYWMGTTMRGSRAVIVSRIIVLSSSSGGVTGTNRMSICPTWSICEGVNF